MTPLLAQRPRQDRQFERLYRKHVGDVYRYSLAVLHNQADAEDVTQTTFLNAYRAFQKGERPDVPKNWLITIAHNVCRQRFRQSSRRPNEVAFVEEIAPAVEEADERYSVEEIQRALAQLQFNQRSAIVMRELEGRSYGEIAQILGLTVGAVETLLFRARRALREQLEGALSCADAELSLSRDADGVLPRSEKGALRAHLRECKSCATVARRQRAQRGALKALGAVPVPGPLLGWITSVLGGGGAAAGSTVAVKAAAMTAAGLLVAGGGIEGKQLVEHRNVSVAPRAAQAAKPKPKPAPRHAAGARVISAVPSASATASITAPRLQTGEHQQGQGEEHQVQGDKGQDQNGLGHKGDGGDDGDSASVAETERHDAAKRDGNRAKEGDAERRSNSGKGGDGEDKQPAATADAQAKGGGDEGKDGEQGGVGDGSSGSSGSSGHDSSGGERESDKSGKDGGQSGDGAVALLEQSVIGVQAD